MLVFGEGTPPLGNFLPLTGHPGPVTGDENVFCVIGPAETADGTGGRWVDAVGEPQDSGVDGFGFFDRKKKALCCFWALYIDAFLCIYIYIYICDICILWIYHRHCGSPFVLHGVILKVVFPKLSRLRVALRCGQWWDLSLTIWFIGEAAISAFGGQGSTHFATGPRGLLDRWSGVFGRKRVLRVTLEVLPITLVAELRASPFWFWDIHGRSWRLIDADIERWRRWKRRWKWIHRFCP